LQTSIGPNTPAVSKILFKVPFLELNRSLSLRQFG
jgi:hypothetical protein